MKHFALKIFPIFLMMNFLSYSASAEYGWYFYEGYWQFMFYQNRFDQFTGITTTTVYKNVPHHLDHTVSFLVAVFEYVSAPAPSYCPYQAYDPYNPYQQYYGMPPQYPYQNSYGHSYGSYQQQYYQAPPPSEPPKVLTADDKRNIFIDLLTKEKQTLVENFKTILNAEDDQSSEKNKQIPIDDSRIQKLFNRLKALQMDREEIRFQDEVSR